MKNKRETEGDDFHCSALRCRKSVDPGHGIQWLDEEGEMQRYCAPCYCKKLAKEEGQIMEGKT